ncbi:HNH endonuclease [Pseudomonas sp. AL 58]|uniref:HNH endonuclease n=1 Tax=Pseudomonas sp. AL 58 TaxID=3104275 RepID=UPI002ECD94CE|nr:HNH endonuclease [Pseudomonas sp. AL 58]
MSDPKTMIVGRSMQVSSAVYFLDKQGREIRPIFQRDRSTGLSSYRIYPHGGNEKAQDVKVFSQAELVMYAKQGKSIRCLLPGGASSNRSLMSEDVASLVVEDELSSPRRYWWVNHKQTYQAELEGGYIWSPTKNQNGARNQTYINLTLVRPGDLIVSYAGAQIKAIGVAISRYEDQVKPDAFGQAGQNWSDAGWLVAVEWIELEHAIIPKDHITAIAKLLPAKNSPLQANGNGNQGCYLASISSELGSLILGLSQSAGSAIAERVQELEDELKADEVESEIKLNQELLPTEREQLVRSRIGQGAFRLHVLELEKACRLTGVSDGRFLIASHIKPWKDCSNFERLDGHNGLMLAPHVDKLFDRGWITFHDNGELLIADEAESVVSAWGLTSEANVGEFTPEQRQYLEYHRLEVFKGR